MGSTTIEPWNGWAVSPHLKVFEFLGDRDRLGFPLSHRRAPRAKCLEVRTRLLVSRATTIGRRGGGLRPIVRHVSLPAVLVVGLRPESLGLRVVHRLATRPIVFSR